MEPKQDKWVGEFSDWCDGVLSAPLQHEEVTLQYIT